MWAGRGRSERNSVNARATATPISATEDTRWLKAATFRNASVWLRISCSSPVDWRGWRSGTPEAATASMAIPRDNLTATPLANGRVLVVGGVGQSTTELYDPPTGTWIAGGTLNQPRWLHEAVRLRDGRVLLAGGGDQGKVVLAEVPGVAPGSRVK